MNQTNDTDARAIETHELTKKFGNIDGITNLDLDIERGEIYGFIGPNGSGKSTTINLLLDFVRPTSGEGYVLGHDIETESVAIRERTGLLPENIGLYDRLTGRKHIELAVTAKDATDDPDAVLDRVGLEDAGERKVGGYSTGMKQRLGLAMALVGDPDLLILDEPSSGLDPSGVKRMREIIHRENERGATVFFSSHILSEVEAVCDQVGILRDGELIAEDSVERLREQIGAKSIVQVSVAGIDEDVLAELRASEGVASVSATDGTITVECTEPEAKSKSLATVENSKMAVRDFSTKEASLEELFEAYTTERTDG